MSTTEPLGCGLEYQPLSLAWLPQVLEVEREAYADPWTELMFQQELHNGASHFHVACRNGQLVGYAGFWLVLDEAHVTKVTVAQAFRGLGLGVALMEHVFAWTQGLGAACIRLEVREGNTAARNLYLKCGFEPIRIRHGYYARTQENAVEMVRYLKPASSRPQNG